MIDKKRLCNIIRSHYPKAFGIRKVIQGQKVRRLTRFYLTQSEIDLCETNPEMIDSVLTPYLKKWNKLTKPIIREMEEILEKREEKPHSEQALKALKNDILLCWFAYGFLPSEYFCYGFESKSWDERKTYVSDIGIKEFGYTVNDITVMQSIIDKGKSYQKYNKYFRRDGVVLETPNDYPKFISFIKAHPTFVKKVVLSSMGKGVEKVDAKDFSGREEEYFREMIKKGRHLLEECVVQVPEMAVFNASSINTIRCITLKIQGEVRVPWCFMRSGRGGSFVDNGGAGGFLIGVDPVTGVVISDGHVETGVAYEFHPDSNVRFKGFQVPCWSEMIAFCKAAAQEIDDVNYLSWDMALTEKGWVVIEINEVGQIIGPQTTLKKGVKSELMGYMSQMAKYV